VPSSIEGASYDNEEQSTLAAVSFALAMAAGATLAHAQDVNILGDTYGQ
jgi:hypothetical protein